MARNRPKLARVTFTLDADLLLWLNREAGADNLKRRAIIEAGLRTVMQGENMAPRKSSRRT